MIYVTLYWLWWFIGIPLLVKAARRESDDDTSGSGQCVAVQRYMVKMSLQAPQNIEKRRQREWYQKRTGTGLDVYLSYDGHTARVAMEVALTVADRDKPIQIPLGSVFSIVENNPRTLTFTSPHRYHGSVSEEIAFKELADWRLEHDPRYIKSTDFDFQIGKCSSFKESGSATENDCLDEASMWLLPPQGCIEVFTDETLKHKAHVVCDIASYAVEAGAPQPSSPSGLSIAWLVSSMSRSANVSGAKNTKANSCNVAVQVDKQVNTALRLSQGEGWVSAEALGDRKWQVLSDWKPYFYPFGEFPEIFKFVSMPNSDVSGSLYVQVRAQGAHVVAYLNHDTRKKVNDKTILDRFSRPGNLFPVCEAKSFDLEYKYVHLKLDGPRPIWAIVEKRYVTLLPEAVAQSLLKQETIEVHFGQSGEIVETFTVREAVVVLVVRLMYLLVCYNKFLLYSSGTNEFLRNLFKSYFAHGNQLTDVLSSSSEEIRNLFRWEFYYFETLLKHQSVQPYIVDALHAEFSRDKLQQLALNTRLNPIMQRQNLVMLLQKGSC
eukprot:TRINITY_DN15479_c0_g1_i1.p1 TRINITY_DN15479_c0_g1~~TRINITY_DN15479_c0_g1_i1.p1  ORF type:complete len:548 (-),score=33.02 TRINITY_DN15479_c0_g1_i1:235-1878(-)